MNNENMKKKLSKDITISPLVEKRIDQTYTQMRAESKKTNRFLGVARKVATAAAVTVMISGTTVFAAYATGNADFLNSVFGTDGRQSTKEEKVILDDSKGGTYEYTIPAQEVVPVEKADMDKAQKYVKNIGKSIQLGDHKLTLLEHISAGHTGVVSYKLECPTGVTMIENDPEKLLPGYKGLSFSDGTKFYIYLGTDADSAPVAGRISIDSEKSTDTCYYLNETYLTEEDSVTKVFIDEFNMSIDEATEIVDGKTVYNEARDMISRKPIDISAEKQIEDKLSIMNGKGMLCEISPMGIYINTTYYDGDTPIEHWPELKSLVINYSDGSNYVVFDNEKNVDNSTYAVGGISCNVYMLAFNRLIDTDKVESVSINDQTYTK